MKATGIVRRIDDLGRVVIPKEIRRTMRIRDGEPLEIYTTHDGEVIFKKYSPMGELFGDAQRFAKALAKTTGCTVAIGDRDVFIAGAGTGHQEILDKPIGTNLSQWMQERQTYVRKAGEKSLTAIDGDEKNTLSVAVPILSEGDLVGTVALFSSNYAGETELKMAQTAALYLGKQFEN